MELPPVGIIAHAEQRDGFVVINRHTIDADNAFSIEGEVTGIDRVDIDHQAMRSIVGLNLAQYQRTLIVKEGRECQITANGLLAEGPGQSTCAVGVQVNAVDKSIARCRTFNGIIDPGGATLATYRVSGTFVDAHVIDQEFCRKYCLWLN